ncbi:MAG: hypothetical protein ABI947_25675 [Chloroflexota bacterium]
MRGSASLFRTVIARLVVIIFGLVLALLIAEVGVRLLYGSLPMNLQIALRNVRVTPFGDQGLAPPSLWQADTDYLTIVRPGVTDSLQAGSPNVTFHVTSSAWWGGRVGFRSPQPQDGNVEAVALGDSFTFCFTEVEACWVSLVAQNTGLNISNLGQPVTGSVSHARIFYDFVAKPELKLKQPKLVLWQFYGNDYNDDYGLTVLDHTNKTTEAASQTRPLPQGTLAVWLRENSAIYLLISSLVRGKDPGVEQFVDPYHVKNGDLDLWFGQSYIRDAFDLNQPRNQEGETLSQQAIVQTRDLVEKNGGKFVVVVMPTKEEAYRSLTEPQMGKAAIDAIAAPRLNMLDLCQSQHLVCFDALPTLQTEAAIGHQVYFPTDPHLNDLGNRLVGEAVSEFLKTQGLNNVSPQK